MYTLVCTAVALTWSRISPIDEQDLLNLYVYVITTLLRISDYDRSIWWAN